MYNVYTYDHPGWTELGAFAAMREFLAGTRWMARGLDVDTTANRVFSRLTGDPNELITNYGGIQFALRARLALPEGYLARTDKELGLLSPWNGPQVIEVAGPGWSANKSGFVPNPNGRAHGMVWAPSQDSRALGLMPADAPGILAIHKSGVMGSLLQVWHALRDGSTQQFFDLMAKVVLRETGEPMDMNDVFVVCVLGARVGFGLTKDARSFMIREADTRYAPADLTPRDWTLDTIFGDHINKVADRFSKVNYTVEERPYDLDLGHLGYALVLHATVNDTRIPHDQVIFDPRCTLTWRNEDGVLTRQSKRLLDGQEGEGAFTGDKPAKRFATCWSGFAVHRDAA